MRYFRRLMTVPATESQMAVALGISLFVMSLLLWGVLWQSQVIASQRQVIKFLYNFH